jgi:hypothetical protein
MVNPLKGQTCALSAPSVPASMEMELVDTDIIERAAKLAHGTQVEPKRKK